MLFSVTALSAWHELLTELKRAFYHLLPGCIISECKLYRVTTLPGKSWNLVRPFSRPGKSWKTPRSWKVTENDDDVREFFCKNALEFLFL